MFVFIFFQIGLSGFSQKYHPFPVDSADWSEVLGSFNIGGPGPAVACSPYHYGLFGDTLIGNKNYNLLLKNNDPSDTAFDHTNASFIMAIREDSSKKVWMRRSSDTLDVLFYDFGLNVGDTFFSWREGPLVVINIDSILINNSYRRVQVFDYDSISMIEGIGFKSGLFGPYRGTDSFSLLKCFKRRGNLIYEYPSLFLCDCIHCHCKTISIGIEYSVDDENKFKIYPNPVTQLLSISFNSSQGSGYHIEIFSASGKKVLSTEVNGGNNEIDVAHLKQGFYLIRIENSENLYYGKFLKTMP